MLRRSSYVAPILSKLITLGDVLSSSDAGAPICASLATRACALFPSNHVAPCFGSFQCQRCIIYSYFSGLVTYTRTRSGLNAGRCASGAIVRQAYLRHWVI
jgi:hypothetical protein